MKVLVLIIIVPYVLALCSLALPVLELFEVINLGWILVAIISGFGASWLVIGGTVVLVANWLGEDIQKVRR